jgi:branched-chain amino acid transport system ATP-binding protein
VSTLELSDVRVERGGREVVRGVSLQAHSGEITALLGPNGAGKSSLVLAIAGVIPVSSGEIKAGEETISGRRPELVRRAGVATVPEGHRILGKLTVDDNLRVATGRLARGEREAALERVQELFPQLRKLGDRFAGTLSGGEQQMLALAQGMLERPSFLIIDELSLGLAPGIVKRLVPAIEQIAAEGTGVLLIEQFTSLALRVASTAHVLVRGSVRLSENAAELRDDAERLQAAYHLSEAAGSASSNGRKSNG